MFNYPMLLLLNVCVSRASKRLSKVIQNPEDTNEQYMAKNNKYLIALQS